MQDTFDRLQIRAVLLSVHLSASCWHVTNIEREFLPEVPNLVSTLKYLYLPGVTLSKVSSEPEIE